VGEIVPENV